MHYLIGTCARDNDDAVGDCFADAMNILREISSHISSPFQHVSFTGGFFAIYL